MPFQLHCLRRTRCMQGRSAAPKVSHLRTRPGCSSSPLPLMAARTNWRRVASAILKMKLKWNDSPSGLSEKQLFKGPIWQLSRAGVLWGELSMSCFISPVCCWGWDVMWWQSASQHLFSGSSCQITARANKLSHGYWVYSLTLFCVCWLMARNLLRGFGLVWNWGQKCLRITFS